MAKFLARGVASSGANPVLDLWAVVDGAIADLEALEYAIWDLSDDEPAQVYPVSGNEVVDVATTYPDAGGGRLALGHFFAAWTPSATERLGAHEVVWQATLPGGETREWRTRFDVLATGRRAKGPMYALLSDLRTEGFTVAALKDDRALALISTASKAIERYTRRFFEPRALAFTVSGEGGRVVHLEHPVIALASIAIQDDALTRESFKVFNRHIAEGLLHPDDRDNPRVEFGPQLWGFRRFEGQAPLPREVFWTAPRNVALEGLFGYTEPDEDSPTGTTPNLITRATMMIVAREQTGIGDVDGRKEASRGAVKDERTRDQSISYGTTRADLAGSSGSGVGEFTGDPAIDDIIGLFCAPPYVGSC